MEVQQQQEEGVATPPVMEARPGHNGMPGAAASPPGAAAQSPAAEAQDPEPALGQGTPGSAAAAPTPEPEVEDGALVQARAEADAAEAALAERQAEAARLQEEVAALQASAAKKEGEVRAEQARAEGLQANAADLSARFGAAGSAQAKLDALAARQQRAEGHSSRLREGIAAKERQLAAGREGAQQQQAQRQRQLEGALQLQRDTAARMAQKRGATLQAAQALEAELAADVVTLQQQAAKFVIPKPKGRKKEPSPLQRILTEKRQQLQDEYQIGEIEDEVESVKAALEVAKKTIITREAELAAFGDFEGVKREVEESLARKTQKKDEIVARLAEQLTQLQADQAKTEDALYSEWVAAGEQRVSAFEQTMQDKAAAPVGEDRVVLEAQMLEAARKGAEDAKAAADAPDAAEKPLEALRAQQQRLEERVTADSASLEQNKEDIVRLHKEMTTLSAKLIMLEPAAGHRMPGIPTLVQDKVAVSPHRKRSQSGPAKKKRRG